MKTQDLIVNRGFCDNGPHYGAWGVVTSRTPETAAVTFTRLHGPRPATAIAEILSAVRFMASVSVSVPVEELKKVEEIPGPSGAAAVWEWYPAVLPQQIDTIRMLWIDALRGGEYAQTRHCLRDRKGFSAMGVACDVIGKRHGITWRHMPRVAGILGSYTTLPKAFLKLLGIDAAEAEFIEKLSDSGSTFAEIAQLIVDRHAPGMRMAS